MHGTNLSAVRFEIKPSWPKKFIMQVAFYAPLKSPTSEVPSGDRRIARFLMQALRLKGHSVHLASEFKSREPKGLPEVQLKLKIEGLKVAQSLIAGYNGAEAAQKPDIWFTYHLYYKAIDWIGPIVSKALNIPYIVVEASYAPKRSGGDWDVSHKRLGQIIKKADIIFELNSMDRACVAKLLGSEERLVSIKPFMELPEILDSEKYRLNIISKYRLHPRKFILVTVAMMREDAKLQSYKVLSQAVVRLRSQSQNWQLLVIGDGSARRQIEMMIGQEQVHYLGELTETEIRPILSGGDLFVWPSVNEAYGMAMLEAQAMGLPVVAGRTGGVGDIVRHNETGLLCEVGNANAFADAIILLLENSNKRASMSLLARKYIRSEHGIEHVADILDYYLTDLVS
jgi:glycosyltransferase involved in cell wall biosynthesis